MATSIKPEDTPTQTNIVVGEFIFLDKSINLYALSSGTPESIQVEVTAEKYWTYGGIYDETTGDPV